MTTAIFLFLRVIKSLSECSLTHFDRKVGIYIATKLFQFTSWKEPRNPSRTDSFFQRCSRRRVRPSYGDFLNCFAIKAPAGPYVSYDKLLFHTTSGLSGSKSEQRSTPDKSLCYQNQLNFPVDVEDITQPHGDTNFILEC